MSILNYTSEVPVDRTLNEIQKKLATAGANAIMLQYDGGEPASVAFRLDTPSGLVSFQLPANFNGVRSIMFKGKRTISEKQEMQVRRTSWRILKDWIEAQLALVQAQMATPLQVFLPYAQTREGTVYECIERGGSANLLSDQRG